MKLRLIYESLNSFEMYHGGKEVANFFVQNGADAIVDDQSGDEEWLIVFNPNIIKSYDVVKNVPVENYMLPKINK